MEVKFQCSIEGMSFMGILNRPIGRHSANFINTFQSE